jgi:hypothetical protein
MEKAESGAPESGPQDESESDPGLVIMYAPDQTIHDTLNHAGAPVRQGATAADSAAALKEYVYRTILSTPVSAEENGVDKGAGVYYPDIFHRLPQDTYHSVLLKLQRVFILDSTSVATWSRQVSAPPKPPLGTLLRVTGGVGKGQVYVVRCAVDRGIFRNP